VPEAYGGPTGAVVGCITRWGQIMRLEMTFHANNGYSNTPVC